jgi:hypothetical protein
MVFLEVGSAMVAVLGSGVPFSPMLFVLLMECFHALIPKVESHGLLQELGGNTFRFHTSLYVNDVVAFFSPVELDLWAIKKIMSLF